MQGPTLAISEAIHAQKYRGEGEGFKEAMNRIASPLTEGPEEFHAFRDMLLEMRFMPAGRVQQAIGSIKRTTPYNCFVSGTIADSFVSGQGSIMDRAKEAAATMRMGGGIGYDFSTLRPSGDLVRKLMSQATGPTSFMRIYNEVGLVTASSGHRRGAQMGVLRIDHPDIERFIRAKQNATELTGFNVSIAVTDQFMECLRDGRPFPLTFDRRVYTEVDPAILWETVMRSTWDWAEPGVLFIDTINRMNNLWYCELIAATNPCGEQPLPPYGACLLGSFNLVKYLIINEHGVGFDYDKLRADVHLAVRAMDRVVDVASAHALFPLHEQEEEAKAKRRMGLGVTGTANAIEVMGHPYGTPAFVAKMGEILNVIKVEAYRASAMLAKERGPFPAYREEEYLEGPFVMGLPSEVRDLIAAHGIRNSHLLSLAPTGTISLCADNVSSVIEPVFAHEADRTVQTFEGPVTHHVEDYGVRVLGHRGRTAAEVTPDEHLAVLVEAYKHVDSAVSKTCNVPADTPWEDFKQLYVKAWEGGAKGCTTYQMGGKRGAVITEKPSEEESATEASCRIDTETGRRDCD